MRILTCWHLALTLTLLAYMAQDVYSHYESKKQMDACLDTDERFTTCDVGGMTIIVERRDARD